MKDGQYGFLDWRSASGGEKIFAILAIALWLLATAAWVAMRVWTDDPRLHPMAETAGLLVWGIMLCTVVGNALYKRYRTKAGR